MQRWKAAGNGTKSGVGLTLSMLMSVLGLGLQACAARHVIVASTGTVIGVEISQSQANQSPQMKLGYNRGEIAIVPSNRSGGEEPVHKSEGAKNVGDVLVELRYTGIFSTSGRIYQRVAVGPNAVAQPGASLMFAKDADGNLSDEAAEVLKSLKTIPAPNPDTSKAQVPLQ